MISISFVIIAKSYRTTSVFWLNRLFSYVAICLATRSPQQFCTRGKMAPLTLKGSINFITCFPPEIPCGLAFIPSILKRVQRWRAALMRSILLIIFIDMHACMICISRVMIFTLLTVCSNEVSQYLGLQQDIKEIKNSNSNL